MSIINNTPGHPKKVLVALPAPLLDALDIRARAECRSRSDLMREACRKYLGNGEPIAFAQLTDETRRIMNDSLDEAEAIAKKNREEAENKRIDKLVSERIALRLVAIETAVKSTDVIEEPKPIAVDNRDPVTASLDLPAPKRVKSLLS